MVSQVGHLGQHRFWAPEELADDTIGASRFLVILSTPRNGSNSNLQAPPNHPGYGKLMAIDTQALGELDVQDVTGAAVRVGSAWAKGPAVLVFLRHFG